ncbi:MAG: hypothetical protein FWE53_01025 [Firmicutes bacterium]|nr:hypothetical protein [Bacillota bacterium]
MIKIWLFCISCFVFSGALTAFGLVSPYVYDNAVNVYATGLEFSQEFVSAEIGTEIDIAETNALIVSPSNSNTISFVTGWEGAAAKVGNKLVFNKTGVFVLKSTAKASRNKTIDAEFTIEIYDNNVYAAGLEFNQDAINLYSNAAPYKTANALTVLGSGVTVEPELSYNSSVISYDINTGQVTAVSSGSTTVTAKIKTAFNTYATASFVVNVSNFEFSAGICMQDSFVLKTGVPDSESPILGGIQIDYEILDTNVVKIESGRLIAVAPGTTGIIATAVIGYDFEPDEFVYETKTASITVENKAAEAIIHVCDGEFNVLGSTDVLRSGKRADNSEALYYFRLSNDAGFTDKLCELELISGGEYADINPDGAFVSGEYIFVPFGVVGSGNFEIFYTLLDDSDNYYHEIISNTLEFEVRSFISGLDIKPMIGGVEISKTGSGYKLYIMSTDPAVTAQAAASGISGTCSLVWLNERDDVEILIEVLTPAVLSIEGRNVAALSAGNGSIKASALDGSGVVLIINIEVEVPVVYNAVFKQYNESYNIVLNVGESFNLDELGVAAVYPYYAAYTAGWSIGESYPANVLGIDDQNNVVALLGGVAEIVIDLGSGVRQVYTVTVVVPAFSIDIDSEWFELGVGQADTLNYFIFDPDGVYATNQDVEVIFTTEFGEEVSKHSRIDIWAGTNMIVIINVSLTPGETVYIMLKHIAPDDAEIYSSVVAITGK